MDKDDILAKSRQENQGIDEYERVVQEKAGRISMQVGMLACCGAAVLQAALTGRVSKTSWMIYFSILATTFWVKHHYLHRRHELLVAILYTFLFLFFAALFYMELVG